jgi:hypothetical protein
MMIKTTVNLRTRDDAAAEGFRRSVMAIVHIVQRESTDMGYRVWEREVSFA